MIKSQIRTTEYCVIIQPRYREQPPICYKGYAKNEEEAMKAVFNVDWHKNILDIKVNNEMEWNSGTVRKYWREYGEPMGEIEAEVKLF